MSNKESHYSKIISGVTTPLGFFVLALLIVESFLSSVSIFANIDCISKIWGIVLGALLFVLVVALVFILVWNKPKNLTFDKESHLKSDKNIPFGSNDDAIKPEERFKSPRTATKRTKQ